MQNVNTNHVAHIKVGFSVINIEAFIEAPPYATVLAQEACFRPLFSLLATHCTPF